MVKDRLGWILVHSHSEYPVDAYETPIDELRGRYKQNCLWHWGKMPKPISIGGPYILMFAWEGEIFGEGNCKVTHAVRYAESNVAFKLSEYRELKKYVALATLPVPKRTRSLIKLTPEILAAYKKLSKR